MAEDDERRIDIHEGPYQDGTYMYTLYWMAEYHPGHPEGEYRRAERGQVFRGNPDQHGVPPARQRDLRGQRS
jgi:hypothetical protein